MKKIELSYAIKWFAVGLAALGLGLLIGLLSAVFLHIVDWGQDFLWESAWSDFPFAPLVICSIGGLLVGLCQRYLGNHPKSIMEATQELMQTGRLAYDHLLQGLLTVGTSLIFGASLGPEAAIMDLLGGLSTWVADMLRGLRNKLQLPHAQADSSHLRRYAAKWPNILAVAIATLAFGYGVRTLYGGGLLSMQETFTWHDLVWALPLGVIGAILGWLYFWFSSSSQKLMQSLKHLPVLRTTLAGAALGLAASLLPMMLFSGQHDLQSAYNQAAQMGSWMLLLIAFVRLFLIALLLSSGWKGGQFLPLMFASTALGLACSQVVPAISAPAGILAVMTGLLAVVFPKPIIAFLMMVVMFPIQYAGIIFVAVTAAAFTKTRVSGARFFHPKSVVAITE